MAEQSISNRIVFPLGEQSKLFDRILEKLSVHEAANICGFSERTIRDWRRGKFSVDARALHLLCKKVSMPFPSQGEIRNRYWYTTKGAFLGGSVVFKKYGRVGGDEEYRKRKWHEWWKREGQYKPTSAKRIQEPIFSPEVAEFVGIILGDGGISHAQVTVTLHAKDDREYAEFVIGLMQSLFDVPVGIHRRKEVLAIDYVVSRRALVKFCTEKLGLKQGNKIKHQVDIPQWIKNNKEYSIACVRGLVDTDGSVFDHRYKVNGKQYSYKKLSFTSRSEPLRQSVFEILEGLELRARFGSSYDVRIDSREDVKRYFQIIG